MKSKMEANIRLAFEMGYKLSLLNTYFSAISNQTISEDRIQQTISYVKKELESLGIYYKSLFGNTIPRLPPLEGQGDITKVLADFYNHTETMIHVHHFGGGEAAFKLGGLLSLFEMAPPAKENVDAVLKRVQELLDDMGLKPKKLGKVIKKLASFDDEERRKACAKISEHVLGKKPEPSVGILKNLGLEIGIPSGIKIVKKWE